MLAPTAMCRRSIEHCGTPPCRPPSFRCAIGTPQRRCNPPPFATTYRDIAPGVTPGQRRGRHEVPPHAAPATTRGLYPRMGRSRHRTSGPRQRAIAAGASRLSRIREAPALPGMGSDQRTRQHCSPRYRHWPLPEEADCSSCTDRGETGAASRSAATSSGKGGHPRHQLALARTLARRHNSHRHPNLCRCNDGAPQLQGMFSRDAALSP